MFSRLFHVSPRARLALVCGTLAATTTTARSLSNIPGAEVLYQRPSEMSLFPAHAGRTAVCFVDGRNEAKAALQEAIRSKRSEDKLIVVHFVDSEAPLFIDFPAAIVSTPEELAAQRTRVYQEAKEMTLQYKSILEAHRVTNVELVLMPCDRPQARAVKFLGDVGAEVVYVGTHNLGPIARTILGSFSHHILHNTKGCVIIAREKPQDDIMKPLKMHGWERLGGGVSEVLQAFMMRDTSHLLRKDLQQSGTQGKSLDKDEFIDVDEDDKIDGFILVGPPSLS